MKTFIRANALGSMFFTMTERAVAEFFKSDAALTRLMREHSEGSAKETRLAQVADHSAVSTIVFAGMCLEAEAYDYAAIHLTDAYTTAHLDKLDLISKWVLIPKLITGHTINRTGKTVQYLRSLTKARNSLVHAKSESVGDPIKFASKHKNSGAQIRDEVCNSYRAICYLAADCDVLHSDDPKPLWYVPLDDKARNPLVGEIRAEARRYRRELRSNRTSES